MESEWRARPRFNFLPANVAIAIRDVEKLPSVTLPDELPHFTNLFAVSTSVTV